MLTTATPALIFRQYIQTFAGAHSNWNDVGSVPSDTNVTAPNQKLTVTLSGLMSVGQGPFKIETERVDPTASTVSVVTVVGHPLAGWRYWRTYSVGTNDVVIETGAVDTSGPGLKNYVGYFLFKAQQKKMWKEYLGYILFNIRALDSNAVQGTQIQYNILKGVWDPSTPTQSDILNNVCQASSCN